MRLIWAVIPLLLIGVIGITDSFAQTNSSGNNVPEGIDIFTIFDEETTLLFNESLEKMKEYSKLITNDTHEGVEPFTIFDEETTLLFNESLEKMKENSEFTSDEFSKDVVCRGDLQLIFKSTDGSSACVTSDTSEKLIKRGWGHL